MSRATGERSWVRFLKKYWMDSVVQWRKQRDASLRVPDGWLTLVGLHWLKVGKLALCKPNDR